VGAQFGVTFYKPDPELGFEFHLCRESELRFFEQKYFGKRKDSNPGYWTLGCKWFMQ
jgi:hypothetical protein